MDNVDAIPPKTETPIPISPKEALVRVAQVWPEIEKDGTVNLKRLSENMSYKAENSPVVAGRWASCLNLIELQKTDPDLDKASTEDVEAVLEYIRQMHIINASKWENGSDGKQRNLDLAKKIEEIEIQLKTLSPKA